MARWPGPRKDLQLLKGLTRAPLKFIEWAYKGYYTAADFELERSIPPSPVPSNKEECEATEWTQEPLDLADAPPAAESTGEPVVPMESPPDWGWGNSKKGKKIKKAKTSQELEESFRHREYTVRRGVISILSTRASRGGSHKGSQRQAKIEGILSSGMVHGEDAS
ncbi:MAG: hypothetical protein M1830_000766 [Pleopsidium flavum]|nr:MAG: hypothetical protein M1830_000766 [Pleopsidium flavum]